MKSPTKVVDVTLRLVVKKGDDPSEWNWCKMLGVTHKELLLVEVTSLPGVIVGKCCACADGKTKECVRGGLCTTHGEGHP